MASFRDAKGRAWEVVIDTDAIARVKRKLGVNIALFAQNEFAELRRVLEDPVSLCDLVYVLCEEELTAAGVTDRDLGKAMTGDAVPDAADAVYEAFANFSPSRIREPLLALARKGREIQTAATARAMEAVANLPAAETYLRTATDSPASSASTPAP